METYKTEQNEISNTTIRDEDHFYSKCEHEFKIPANIERGKAFITNCKKCGECTLATIDDLRDYS